MEPGGSSSQQKDNSLQPPRPFPFEVFDQMLLEKAKVRHFDYINSFKKAENDLFGKLKVQQNQFNQLMSTPKTDEIRNQLDIKIQLNIQNQAEIINAIKYYHNILANEFNFPANDLESLRKPPLPAKGNTGGIKINEPNQKNSQSTTNQHSGIYNYKGLQPVNMLPNNNYFGNDSSNQPSFHNLNNPQVQDNGIHNHNDLPTTNVHPTNFLNVQSFHNSNNPVVDSNAQRGLKMKGVIQNLGQTSGNQVHESSQNFVQSTNPSIKEYFGNHSLNEESFHYLNNPATTSKSQAPIILNSLSNNYQGLQSANVFLDKNYFKNHSSFHNLNNSQLQNNGIHNHNALPTTNVHPTNFLNGHSFHNSNNPVVDSNAQRGLKLKEVVQNLGQSGNQVHESSQNIVQSTNHSINEYYGNHSLNEEYFHHLNNPACVSKTQAPINLNSFSEIEKYFRRNKKNIQPSEPSLINYGIYTQQVFQQNKEYPSTNYFGKQPSNNQNFNNPIINSSTQGASEYIPAIEQQVIHRQCKEY
uniref:Uncharacterized protein n=1 Tax=Meloidogyne floridensis TaxID=298350 RepID=A0A915P054_9BILA